MGFFDFLSGKKSDSPAPAKSKSQKEIARLARVVGDKLAQNYDRQDAISQLSAIGTAESAQALTRRFDFTMQPSLTDQEEKEAALEGIVKAGEVALEPLRNYCSRSESITWALRALRRIVPSESLVDELVSLLDQFDTDYTRNPEPKIQLIGTLEEFKSDQVREAVEVFLEDANESVRFHAVGTVFAMENPASLGALLEALSTEESLRVKNRVAGGIAQRGWEIPEELSASIVKALPEDFSLRGGKLARG
jgi:hypothetical protein